MRSPLALAACCLLTPPLSAAAPAQDAASGGAVTAEDVRWRFAAGDEHAYDFHLNAVAEITQFGQTSQTRTDLTVAQTWAVKSVNADGSAVVNRTVDRVTIDSDAGGTETAYDSAADDAVDPKTLPADYRVIAQLAGQTFPSVVAPDGTVKKLTLPEAVTRAIQAAGPGSSFGEEQVKLLFTDPGFALPPAGTKVGDTYESEATLPLQFGDVTDSRTMTLEKLTAESAVIGLKSTLAGAAEAGGPMTVKDGSTDGTIAFDVAAGLLKTMASKQTVELTGPGGFAVTLTSDSTFARAGEGGDPEDEAGDE